jgi:hypothetical protein
MAIEMTADRGTLIRTPFYLRERKTPHFGAGIAGKDSLDDRH